MSHAKPPSDLLDHAEPLDENLLRRALAPRRPRADAFRQGVQKRIEEKRDRLEAERQRQELRLAQAPERLRWAAGIVPVGLVPGALSGAGVVGKKLGVKAFPALFALPLVSACMLAAAFFFGLRNVVRRQPMTRSMTTAEEVTAQWWKRNLKPAIAAIIGIFLLLCFNHREVLTVLFAVSMVFVALILAELARAGLADRASIGKTLGGALFFVGIYSMQLQVMPSVSGGHGAAINIVLWLGACTIAVLTQGFSWSAVREKFEHPIRMEHPDPVSTWLLRALFGTFVAVAVFLGSAYTYLAATSLLPVSVTRNDLVEWVEAPDRLDQEYKDPVAILRTLDELARTEGPAPDTSHLVRTIKELDAEGREQYWVRMLSPELGLDPLPEVELRTLTTLPSTNPTLTLDGLRRRVRELERRGLNDEVERLREITLDALSRSWLGDVQQGRTAGFFATSDTESPLRKDLPPQVTVQATQTAVELMRRFGIPDNVEIDRVRRLFETTAAPRPLDTLLGRPGLITARLGLFQLDSFAPDDSSLSLYDYRGLIGALLLVALCIFATIRAPRETEV